MRDVKITVKRGQVHRENVADWIADARDGVTRDYPEGIAFAEASGLDPATRDTLLGMEGEELAGYLRGLNEKVECYQPSAKEIAEHRGGG